MCQQKKFGFYPKPLEFTEGPVTISPLPEYQQRVDEILASDCVENDWYYPPPKQVSDPLTGDKIRECPYPPRVFGLPKTHLIEHVAATNEDHLKFHVWAL